MTEVAAKPIPRRGRIWVILALLLAVVALGYGLVSLATREAGPESVQVDGISSAQEVFGGIPQAGDRVGSSDASVSVQLFTDLQCASCRDSFLATVPPLSERWVRPGDVKLLLRHYSMAQSPLELGFFAAEAAAQQGYGWQYAYLFFLNQDEAKRLGVSEELLETLAGSIGELDVGEWHDYLEAESGADGEITSTLDGYEELGTQLRIRAQPAAIVSGPGGTRTLQDDPSLAQIEQAIGEVN